jgi:hypothetical protein
VYLVLAAFTASASWGDISTATCPFANHSLDNKYKGQPIVEYKYGSTNLCVATNSSGGAVLVRPGRDGRDPAVRRQPGVQAYLNYGGFGTCWGVN